MCKKGVFPYSWFDTVGKFDYPELPKRIDFYD